MKQIEVILSQVLFDFRSVTDDCIVVIIDVLRATTAICAAFDSGIEMVIPVSGLEELLALKSKGYLTAAERDGKKVSFADFGNSPTVFLKTSMAGKVLAYSTTNGTQAIEMAKQTGNILLASFANLVSACEWLKSQEKDVVILCSGWKNTVSLEDTLCAGAMVEALAGDFASVCDASELALSQWMAAKNKLRETAEKGEHYQRLIGLKQSDDLQHCFTLNTSKAVPCWDGKGFRNVSA
jgi:2-phosphosulfolactate phosphatase